MDRMIERSAAVEALVDQRHKAAGTFTPEFMGVQGAAYDRATMDATRAINALPPARFTRGDVEKAARACAEEMDAVWENLSDRSKCYFQGIATAALAAIGEVEP